MVANTTMSKTMKTFWMDSKIPEDSRWHSKHKGDFHTSDRLADHFVGKLRDELLDSYESQSNLLMKLADTGRVATLLHRYVNNALDTLDIIDPMEREEWHSQLLAEREERLQVFKDFIQDQEQLVASLGDKNQQLEIVTLLRYCVEKYHDGITPFAGENEKYRDKLTSGELNTISLVYDVVVQKANLVSDELPDWFVTSEHEWAWVNKAKLEDSKLGWDDKAREKYADGNVSDEVRGGVCEEVTCTIVASSTMTCHRQHFCAVTRSAEVSWMDWDWYQKPRGSVPVIGNNAGGNQTEDQESAESYDVLRFGITKLEDFVDNISSYTIPFSGETVSGLLDELAEEHEDEFTPMDRSVFDRLRDVYAQLESAGELPGILVEDFSLLVWDFFKKFDENLSSSNSSWRLCPGCCRGDEYGAKRSEATWVRGADVIPKWFIPSYQVELEDRIGSGGFAFVNLGKWFGTDVVVKRLKPMAVDENRRIQFRREADLWFTLNHSNLIKLYGACYEGPQPFFVCERATRQTLTDYLKPENGRRRELWFRLLQAALGIEHLHDHNIVHETSRMTIFLSAREEQQKLQISD
ncbi:Protein kinase, ATP binding site [Phytophthora cactorum]|nr:Protein kinase, ATP binding site [Phytophthora cactorum]